MSQDTVDRLEQDCLNIVKVKKAAFWLLCILQRWKFSYNVTYVCFQDKVTTELIQVLDEEERRWAQTLHIEEYQSNLARSVIQV